GSFSRCIFIWTGRSTPTEARRSDLETKVNHVAGKEMYIADTLTRMQSENTNRMATVPEEEMNIYVDSVLDSLSVSDVKLMEIKEAKDADPPNFVLMTY
ncbi:unnamed protein product, partial [Porites lobata]